MKIIILGAGISGLSTYLFLKKHLPNPSPPAQPHQIFIYDAYDTSLDTATNPNSDPEIGDRRQDVNTLTIGGPLGLGPNGLNVFRRLDKTLFNEVVKTGAAIGSWKMSNRFGWDLANIEIKVDGKDAGDGDEAIVPAATAKNNGESGVDEMGSIMLPRRQLWRCLRMAADVEGGIGRKRAVEAGVKPQEDGGGCWIRFEGGDLEEADLLIGADGLRSVVRKAVAGNDGKWEPVYEGLVGVGGYLPSTVLQSANVKTGEMHIVFGNEAFFGYGYTTSDYSGLDTEDMRALTIKSSPPGPAGGWWSTYPQEECPDWRKRPDSEEAIRLLKERHRHWKNPAIQKIIDNVEVDAIYPTWTSPVLDTWSKGGLVLIGDAAHTLQPSSGQGACQALEDAEAFVLFLEHCLRKGYQDPQVSQAETERAAIDEAAKRYVDLRKPRLQEIYNFSQRMGAMKHKMGIVKELLMYTAIWLMAHLPFKMQSDYQERLHGWNGPEEVKKVIERLETDG